MRILIDVINEMDYEKMAEVSERSITLKWLLKVPMILLIFTASLVSGASMLLLKVVDTII